MFTLYHSFICPFSKQIRLILHEKSVQFHLIEENYWEYDINFAKINPAMNLPVLIEPDGASIIGIYSIIEYIFENDRDFFSDNLYQRSEIRRLLSWFNNKLYDEVIKLIIDERIIGFYLAQNQPSSELLRIAKLNLNNHLKYMDYLLNRRKWLAGEKLSIVDFAAAAHFSILDYLGNIDWSYMPIVKEWYSVIKSRPSFQNILQDRILGFVPSKNYINLDF